MSRKVRGANGHEPNGHATTCDVASSRDNSLRKESSELQKETTFRQESCVSSADMQRHATTLTDCDDDASIATVLSNQSQSDDESSMASDSSCLRQLEIEFKVRDKLLKKLTKGIHPIYVQAMIENEAAARRQKIQRAQEKRGLQSSLSNIAQFTYLKQQVGSHETFLGRIRLFVACGLNSTFPGAAHLMLYCLAHSCCFQLIEVTVLAFNRKFKNQDVVAVVIILASMLLLRLTGGIYSYLDYTSYRRVKFDMHNRLRMGKMDAYIIRWFRQHYVLRQFLNLVAFYAVFEFVVYFHERYIELADGYVMALTSNLGRMKRHLFNRDNCAIYGVCDLQEEAARADRSYTVYYLISAVLAIQLIEKLGHNFLKS